MAGQDDARALHAKVERLEQELDGLRGLLIDRPKLSDGDGPADADPPVSRRGLLRLAGVGAAGAAASAVLMSSPASAGVDGDVVLGASNATTTRTVITSSIEGEYAFQADNSNASDVDSSGIGGNSNASGAHGVEGISFFNSGTGAGVHGTTNSPAGAGVLGAGATLGTGVAGTATGAGSVGVRGTGRTGVSGTSSGSGGIGVSGTTATTGTVAIQANPTEASSIGFEVNAPGTDVIGVKAAGTRAPLWLVPAVAPGAPTGSHSAGELWVDSVGDCYLCTASGGPGTWTKLNNQGAGVGGLQLVNPPQRVYDSRVGQPNPSGSPQGALAFGQSRTINCSPVVPGGATTIVFNLTVAGTVGSFGALAIFSASAPDPNTSNLNWTFPNSVVGNQAISACDGSQDVKVKCVANAGCSTQFILDVFGYYA